ncbi:MAG: AmmeMemoRadiSam system protein B [Verrucomicrobiota bacterium]
MKSTAIRPPAVAGMFYPADPDELHQMVSGYLKEAEQTGPAPKAVIVPHAGYVYSGPIAASAYARLAQARGRITRVVLLGPSHRIPFRGLALSSAKTFLTPLGSVPLDQTARAALKDLSQVQVTDQAHALEHSLEVQLPFLQEVLGDFTLVPLAVGDASPEDVGEVLDKLWGGPETLIVISSDLSHYHDYKAARRMDEATSAAIEELNPNAISYDQACGRIPIAGLLLTAKKRGLRAKTIDLRSSGDTAGSKDEVVGYGAYVFE